jgi:hypothetical protein
MNLSAKQAMAPPLAIKSTIQIRDFRAVLLTNTVESGENRIRDRVVRLSSNTMQSIHA